MAELTSPIKVDLDRDHLAYRIPYFLEPPTVAADVPVDKYAESHRDEINDAVRAALTQLDGTPESAVALVTGLPLDQLQQYGAASNRLPVALPSERPTAQVR